MGMSHTADEQFNILRFTTREDLSRIVSSFCRLTGLAGGVVAMPADPSNPPTDEREFGRYRLTDPEVINPCEFCKLVRHCSKGNIKCMWSDLQQAQSAFEQNTALYYPCHIGLIDIVSPIKVAGRHVANVYLGQIRPNGSSFAAVWRKYKELVDGSDVVRENATRKQLEEAFKELPTHGPEEIGKFVEVAAVLGELISQRATRQAAVRVTLDAAQEVGATLNLYTSLSTYLKYAMTLLNSNTGSIFLLSEDKSELRSFACEWGVKHEVRVAFPVEADGLIAKCARENLTHYRGQREVGQELDADDRPNAFMFYYGTREEIDSHGPPQIWWTREKRNLQSLMVIPITHGDELLGTLDIGSTHRHAYSPDDMHVLRLFAREIGLYVRQAEERQQLLRVFGENDSLELGRVLVREIPLHVEGRGCSIFRIKGRQGVLFATDEFPVQGREDIFYEIGEGFTGWVLKSGKPLRIAAGPKCRTENLALDLRAQGIRWKGKYEESDPMRREYYESRPYLAVPVKNELGNVCGAIRISDRKSGSFTEDDQTVLQTFADCLGQLLRHAEFLADAETPGKQKHVFLGYGRNLDARQTIETFLEKNGLFVEYYDRDKEPGEYPFDILLRCIEKSDAAVILYTGDDTLESGERVGRRNVAYELGMAHRTFGRKRTLLLMEQRVEEPTNVLGMQVVFFNKGCLQDCFPQVREYLEKWGLLA